MTTIEVRGTVDARAVEQLQRCADEGNAVTESGLEFYVDPRTYRPIREIVSRPPLFRDSQTFTEYQTAPINAANERLLSLTARHPDARIDRNPSDYRRAAGLRSVFTG